MATVTTLPEKTRDKVAKETGVSHKTITNDANYAQAVDKVSDKLDVSKVKAEPRKDVIALSKKQGITVIPCSPFPGSTPASHRSERQKIPC